MRLEIVAIADFVMATSIDLCVTQKVKGVDL